jgi:hypothetical protein
MLRCPQHDNTPLNILLLYNIKSFPEETEFPTDRESRHEKNVEDTPQEWYHIVNDKGQPEEES